MHTEALQSRILLTAVLLAVGLLYLPSLSADFVNIDDPAYLTLNEDVRHPRLLQILDPRHNTVADWTPVVTLSHVLEHRLFEFAPLPYHATNLLLHLACTALVYLLFRDVGAGVTESLLAALIFGIHPLQVESVAWISSRKNLLAGVFGLLFVRCFLAGRPLLAAVLLALALGSKGTAVAFSLWVAAAWMLGFGTQGRHRAAAWLALYLLLAGARGIVSATMQAPVMAARDVGQMGLTGRMAVMGPVLATQLRQVFAPYDLCLRYLWTAQRWEDPHVLAGWGVVLLAAALIVWAGRRDRVVAFAGACTVAALLPTMNIYPAPDFQADRYAHLALVGGALLAVRLLRPLRRVGAWVPPAVLAGWCAAIAVPATHARIAVWHDSATLWTDTLRHLPSFVFGWNQLAIHYLDHGQNAAAEPVLRHVLELQPDHLGARYNLALLFEQQGATGDALVEARTLITQHPDSVDGHCLLGRLLLGNGRIDEGLGHFDRAVEIAPSNDGVRYARAQANLEHGRLDAAAADLEVLIQSRPRDASLRHSLEDIRQRQAGDRTGAALP